MQLVINIDDKLYEIIKKPKKLEMMYFHAGRLCEVVRNGTPLPKGHGRLIDADERRTEIDEADRWVVDLAQTIIEANKMERKG